MHNTKSTRVNSRHKKRMWIVRHSRLKSISNESKKKATTKRNIDHQVNKIQTIGSLEIDLRRVCSLFVWINWTEYSSNNNKKKYRVTLFTKWNQCAWFVFDIYFITKDTRRLVNFLFILLGNSCDMVLCSVCTVHTQTLTNNIYWQRNFAFDLDVFVLSVFSCFIHSFQLINDHLFNTNALRTWGQLWATHSHD